MARKRKSIARQTLILAFAAGAMTGAASMLTLRGRRQDGDFRAADVTSQLDDALAPSLDRRIDASAQGPKSMPAAQQH
ncbi:hypothetical protein AB0J94_31770 [Micromonospora noduli]|uniref:hypothetical protein n=1 Tax=Micromonospora noduli TaxID=709876 RepID=UPI000DC00BA5|nr:hypothetical protein [Micromonospora noduli]RAO08016.1 hypothetical protein LUPAC07_05946 [Micromonospora noduli]RAO32597.1 hypothetical protein ONO23_03015 [Micromonospora noduli]RAO53805.1 hypothetical protein ONO86_01311 [Micromonospora noduli]